MASTLGTGILRQSMTMSIFDQKCLLESLDCIVTVHEGMHAVVHHHEPAAGGGELNIGVPGKPEDGDMVVPEIGKSCILRHFLILIKSEDGNLILIITNVKRSVAAFSKQ